MDKYTPGTRCTINGGGDLRMVREDGAWIGTPCVIIKRCKSGLIQVAAENNPKMMRSFSQFNITLETDNEDA